MRREFKVVLVCSLGWYLLPSTMASAGQGSVFLTGHDPDFHAFVGGNLDGARHINQRAIDFIMDPAFNTYKAGGVNKFLFVESKISPPSGHVNGVNGIIASGYTLGVDFDHVDASGLNAALDQLGTTYSGLVVASDFGGVLTQAELNILDARADDIFTFVNGGGGLYAMSEHNNGAGLTPDGGWYKFVPIVSSSASLNQSEIGYTVTPFGVSLGLADSDVNGNASHTIFTQWAPQLNVVDIDSVGNVLSLAGRLAIPAPSVAVVMACAGISALGRRRR